MKKILMLFFTVIFCSNALASSIKEIIFLGDSLSDDGNLYKTLKIIPKSPPYYKGRFSNGPTWAEHVGKYYYDKYYIDFANYAYGGATAALHNPVYDPIPSPMLLEMEVNGYLLNSVFHDKSKTLFSIWIGGNDYLFDTQPDIEELTQKVVNKITQAINTLIDNGGRTFLVMNLPDLSTAPGGDILNSRERLKSITILHNEKLASAIQQLQQAHPQLKFIYFDSFNSLNAVINDLETANKKYNVHLKNITDACWEGCMVFKGLYGDKTLNIELQNRLPKGMNQPEVSHFILGSPSLAQAYLVGKEFDSGKQPCPNADEYMFWDAIHPTAVTHKIMSEMVIAKMASEGQGLIEHSA